MQATYLNPEEGKPHLLVLTSTYPRWQGDPEPGFVHELASRLAVDFQVTVLGPHARGALQRERMDGVEVVRFRYAPECLETLVNDGGVLSNLRRTKWKMLLVPTFVLTQALSAWRLVRRKNVGVIHAHWLIPQGLIAALMQLLPGRRVPFLVTSHGADLYALRGGIWGVLKRFVVSRSTAVTVVSSAMHLELFRLRTTARPVHVLPMGVDMEEHFTPDGSAREEDEILFVGRLVEKKGVRTLIEAMPAILAERPQARLKVVGFGPEESSLKKKVVELGLDCVVDFVGPLPQSKLPALYRRAAVFVAPFLEASNGDQEGLGLVTIEAIACGCPVVVGDLPGVREVLGDPQEAHMLVAPGDSVALAKGVVRVLSNPVPAQAEAASLRERIAKRFSWPRVARNYARLLSKACSTNVNTSGYSDA